MMTGYAGLLNNRIGTHISLCEILDVPKAADHYKNGSYTYQVEIFMEIIAMGIAGFGAHESSLFRWKGFFLKIIRFMSDTILVPHPGNSCSQSHDPQ